MDEYNHWCLRKGIKATKDRMKGKISFDEFKKIFIDLGFPEVTIKDPFKEVPSKSVKKPARKKKLN